MGRHGRRLTHRFTTKNDLKAVDTYNRIETYWCKKTTLKPKLTRYGAKLQRLHRSAIPPGQVDSPQRRRDILRAAAELFAVHGYNGVSLRDIAGRANVPVALCTYYFGRKSELFASVFLHSSDHIEKRRAALQAFPESGSLEQLLHLWIDPLMRMRSNPEEAPFAVLSARASWDSLGRGNGRG